MLVALLLLLVFTLRTTVVSIFSRNSLYGGRNLDSASNIVFSNGLLDPWSSGGVLKS